MRTGSTRRAAGGRPTTRARALLAGVVVVSAVGFGTAAPCGAGGVRPACYVTLSPGPPSSTADVVDTARGTASTGTILVTTVAVDPDPGLGAIASAWFEPTVDVVPRRRLLPDGSSLEDLARDQRAAMRRSQQAALAAATAALDGRRPVAAFDAGIVGGPSAGLAFALALVDAGRPDDLTGGRTIAATGAIGPSGVVGAVGGVTQKLVGALRRPDGPAPTVFLLPQANLAEAVAVAVDRPLLVVPVRDLAEAVTALEALRGGADPLGAVALGAG